MAKSNCMYGNSARPSMPVMAMANFYLTIDPAYFDLHIYYESNGERYPYLFANRYGRAHSGHTRLYAHVQCSLQYQEEKEKCRVRFVIMKGSLRNTILF